MEGKFTLAAVALRLDVFTVSSDRETLMELALAYLAWQSPCQKRFCEGGTTKPSSNPEAIHRESNESYALKFGGALKIDCFALLEMTELGIYQALSMCRKTLQPNRRLMTKRWELSHRNLRQGVWAIDKNVETTLASERLYRIGSKPILFS